MEREQKSRKNIQLNVATDKWWEIILHKQNVLSTMDAMWSYNIRPDPLKHQLVSWIFTFYRIQRYPVSLHWKVRHWICQNNHFALAHCNLQTLTPMLNEWCLSGIIVRKRALRQNQCELFVIYRAIVHLKQTHTALFIFTPCWYKKKQS